MEIVQRWLSETILKDLGEALNIASSKSPGALRGRYEDDGSNLRVQLSKQGVVQIIKWGNHNRPFGATLSDSEVYMEATISSGAATIYQNRTGLTVNNALGNVIQIQNAEVVATHLGPRPLRITLLVNNFKVLGSDKSGQFGSPRPLEATSDYSGLLKVLSAYRNVNATGGRPPTAGPSELTSADPRLRSPLSTGENHYGSQQFFSQIPARSESSRRPAQSEEKPVLAAQPLIAQMSNTAHESSRNYDPVNQKAKLLEMLKAKQTSKSIPGKDLGLPEPATKTLSPLEDVVTAQQIVPSLEAGPSSALQPEPEQSLSASPAESSKVKNQTNAPTKSKSKKIRSRDTKISNEQRKLLDQEDSWLPAEPGRRGPVANVPITILQEFTKKVEQRATTKSRRQSEESLRKDELDDQRDQRSDSPVPSVDWPPSSPIPARNELPPDSSAEMAECSDDEDKTSPQHLGASAVQEDTSRSSEIAPSSRRESTTSLIQITESQPEAAASTSRQPNSRQSTADRDLAPSALTNNTTSSSIEPNSNLQFDSMAAVDQEASENDSDIEMSVPIGLNDSDIAGTDRSTTYEIPATALEPQEPFTQVKRTPDANGPDRWSLAQAEQHSSAPEILSSPSKRRRIDSLGTARAIIVNDLDDVEGLSPKSSYHPRHLQSPGGPSQTQAFDVKETILNHQTQREALHQMSSALERVSNANSPLRNSAQMSDSTVGVTSQVVDKQFDTIGDSGRRNESPILSPFVSKRRKVHRSPSTFKFTQEEYPKEDPSITARRYRQEFFASRKNSRSKSYVSLHEVVPDNVSSASHGRSGGFAAVQDPTAATEEIQGVSKMPHHPCDHPDAVHSSPMLNTNNARGDPPILEKAVGSTDERLDESSCGTPMLPTIEPTVIFPATNPTYKASAQVPVAASAEQSSLLLAQSIQPDLHSVSTKLESLSSTEISQQTNRSGQAQSLPELMTPALSVTEIPQRVSPAVNDLSKAEGNPPHVGIFSRFKTTYPDYLGTEEHFIGMCKKIHRLLKAGRMEHKSLWDDFVIRHKRDYAEYYQQCMDNAEDPNSYERFYQEEIDEPKYTKRILLPTTLGEVIPIDQTPPAVQEPDLVVTKIKPESPTVQLGAQTTASPGRLEGSSLVRSPLKESSTSIPTRSVPSLELLSNTSDQISVKRGAKESPERTATLDHPILANSKETIDLTGDESSSPTVAPHPGISEIMSKRIGERSPRTIPWQGRGSATKVNGTRNGTQEKHRRGSPAARTLSIDPDIDKSPTTPRLGESELAKSRSEVSNRNGTSKALRLQSQAKAPMQRSLHKQSPQSTTGTPSRIKGQTAKTSSPKKKSRPEPQATAVDEWWKDDNTPFREYVKLYQSITPGKGNAFAKERGKPRAAASENEEEKDKQVGSGREESPELGSKIMDVMYWCLQ